MLAGDDEVFSWFLFCFYLLILSVFHTVFTHTYMYTFIITRPQPHVVVTDDDSKYLSITYFLPMQFYLNNFTFSFFYIIYFNFLCCLEIIIPFFRLLFTVNTSDFPRLFLLLFFIIAISTLAYVDLLNTFDAQHTLFKQFCIPLKIFKRSSRCCAIIVFFLIRIFQTIHTEIITLAREIIQIDSEINK